MRLIGSLVMAFLLATDAAAQGVPPSPPPVAQEFIALPERQTPVIPIESKNIVYLHASGQDLELDVYQQPNAQNAPVVVYLHGGAWWKNARPQTAASFRSLLAMGVSLVTVDYRLTGVAPAPAAVQDARCSLAWVKKNAARFHFDLDKVLVFGTSSGGHLALMAGMLPAGNSVDLPGCQDVPKVAAILDFYGITDVEELLGDRYTLQRSSHNWLGNVPDQHALARQMSPLSYVRPGLPPVFIVHGNADPVVPYEQSTRLRDALAAAGDTVELVTVEGGQHGKFSPEQVLMVGNSLRQFLLHSHLLRTTP